MPVKINLIVALLNPNRRKILKLCKNSPLSFKDLQRNAKFNYCNLWRHIRILKRERLVNVWKQSPESKGRPHNMVVSVFTKERFKELQKKVKEELNLIKKVVK